jgi:DNA helicase HerA-like ATPase
LIEEATEAGGRSPVLGKLIAVGGSHAKIGVEPASIGALAVGRLLEIHSPKSAVVAVVTAVSGEEDRPFEADVDLLGEIVRGADGSDFFQRGISDYPVIGTPIGLLSGTDLRLIYDISGPETINVGTLSQDPSIGAYINVDEMMHKHFAVLGTTGVGKSSGVALILREILRARPKQRIFLIDPHNEYGACFGSSANIFTPHNLHLPHWLFNFEEMVDVIFRARPGIDEEVEILSQAITEAKNRFGDEREMTRPRLRKAGFEGPGYTVDTPVPYRMADLIALIDERMGKLENRAAVPKYTRLLTRIETVTNDPRYQFMFHNANVGGDTMVDVLSDLFNLPEGSGPVSVMQLAGFPAEVVDSVVSVLCRMAFELGLWSGGAIPLLMVCEEAHRYAPSDKTIGFGPTKKAVSRIAKEGRKYSVFLGLVTQRPAELDATIVSQCSTLFAMRMANDRDQDIVRSAVSDAAAGLLAFVPALGTREVFAFGEGVALPTRLRFAELAHDLLPRSSTGPGHHDANRTIDHELIAGVVDRWRRASMSRTARHERISDEDGIGFESPIVKRRPDVVTPERPDVPFRTVEPDRLETEEPARPDASLEVAGRVGGRSNL